VFFTRGYGAVGVEAVAAEAGFTTGAVYSNFDGKADLFLAVLEQSTEAELAAVRAALAKATTDEQRLQVFNTAFAADPRRWRARVSATLEFLSDIQGKPELLARLRERQTLADQALSELVEAVCAAVGVEPPAPPAELAQDLNAALNGLAIRSLYDDKLDLQAAVARAVNALLTSDRSGRIIEMEKTRDRRR
jgi:AcrR family transcriptional regulator